MLSRTQHIEIQAKRYGISLRRIGDDVQVRGPDKSGAEVLYFEGDLSGLDVFWAEFRRIVDPQMAAIRKR